MERTTRYGIATAVGVAAGAASYLLAASTVEPSLAAFAAVPSGLVWAIAAAVFLGNRERLGSYYAVDPDDSHGALLWGGLSGGFASLGVTSVLGLFAATVSLRLGLAVAVLVLGYGLGSLAVGVAATSLRYEGDGSTADGAPSASAGD